MLRQMYIVYNFCTYNNLIQPSVNINYFYMNKIHSIIILQNTYMELYSFILTTFK